MERRPLKRLGAMIGIGLATLILVGCNGSRGQTGASASAVPVVSASALSATDWAGLNLTGTVTSVNMSQGKPQVTFTVTNNDGNPVAGLSANASSTTLSTGATLVSYPNFAFTIAKLVPGSGGNSQWVSYIVSSTPSSTAAAVPAHPGSDNTGTLTEDGLGNYTYTFYRDITQAAAFLQAATYSASKNQIQSDLGDVSYQPTLTHRIGISVGGPFRGTGSNTANGTASSTAAVYPNRSANLIYDFVPATGQVAASAATKVVVDKAACEACHTKLGVSFHTGGAMNDPRYCDTCHTDQQKYGQYNLTIPTAASPAIVYPAGVTSSVQMGGMAVGNMTGFIHRLHMGASLAATGYSFAGVKFNAISYPQDIRNCTTCHTGSTPQSGNYLTVPSVAACGACHDTVNFATGIGHGPGNLVQLSDAACAGCHASDDIQVEHIPILQYTDVSPRSAGPVINYYQATNPSNIPSGAHTISAVISSVSVVKVVGDGVNLGYPTITFSLIADGNTSSPLVFNTPSSTSATNLIGPFSDGSSFQGAPSIFVAMGLPQDGIAPADYNYNYSTSLLGIWNNSATAANGGTLVQSSTTPGLYTLTLTGLKVPPGTNLLIAGLGQGSSLVQTANLGLQAAGAPNPASDPITNFTYSSSTGGGLLVPFQTVWKTASFSTTYAGTTNNSLTRRSIVNPASCNACHSNLGAFTPSSTASQATAAPGVALPTITKSPFPISFHSQGNNDAASCAMCHNPVQDSHIGNASGYSINAKVWVHGLHAASFRTYPYMGQSTFPSITYPGILNNCEACHVAGSYDFSGATNAQQVPNLLWDTIGGTISASGVNVTAQATGSPIAPSAVNTHWIAPASWGVTAGAALGTTFTGAVASAGAPVTTTASATTTLVVSPIAAACSSCHDNDQAIAHMKTIGGATFYAARGAGATLTSTESCLSCHGHGAAEDIAVVHANY